jgi:hypothetical protein
MTEMLDNILAQGIEHLNIILLMGLAIFFGTAGALVFQKFRIPQVERIPVATSSEDDRFVGVLNCRGVRRLLSAKVLSRQQKVDSMHSI